MTQIILIGIGGGLGSILRYLTSVYVAKYIPSAFPLGTFAVNVIGCLIIGLLIGFFEQQQVADSNLKFLFITGFCGGYTTFSAFALENINLFQAGNPVTALFYIGTSILTCLFAVWGGIILTKT